MEGEKEGEMEGEMERQLAAADAASAAATATALAAATAKANATALAAHPSSEAAYDAWLGWTEDVAPRAEAAARYARAAGRGDACYSVVGAPRDGAAARIGGVSVGGGYAGASDGGARISSLERLSAPVRRPQPAGARPSAERTERADVAVVTMPLTFATLCASGCCSLVCCDLVSCVRGCSDMHAHAHAHAHAHVHVQHAHATCTCNMHMHMHMHMCMHM